MWQSSWSELAEAVMRPLFLSHDEGVILRTHRTVLQRVNGHGYTYLR